MNWREGLSEKAIEKKIGLAAAFKPTRHWRRRFYGRFRLTHRKRTNKKTSPLEIRMQIWTKHFIKLREHHQYWTCKAISLGMKTCPKYGIFTPDRRSNGDQIPTPFCNMKNDTIETKGTKEVIVRTHEDDDKRFATTQMTLFSVRDINVSLMDFKIYFCI